MLSLTTILCLYAVAGVAVLLLTVFAKSHRALNVLSIALPASYLALTFSALAYSVLPSYSLGGGYFLIDHLSLYEILISATLFLLAAIYSRGYIEGSIEIHEMDRSSLKLFYFAFNALLILITFAFFSDNLALFWILAELTTAFSGVLIVMLNAPKNIGAALKYIFITSTCMLFALWV
jgi:hydrogenase-4 component F